MEIVSEYRISQEKVPGEGGGALTWKSNTGMLFMIRPQLHFAPVLKTPVF